MKSREPPHTFPGSQTVPGSWQLHTLTWNSKATHPTQAWSHTSGMWVSEGFSFY